jgi:F-type H+-transporting ATPase subunit epsilon
MHSERTFPFEILTPQKAFLRDDVTFIVAPGREGRFEILPGHAPFVFALQPGVLRMRRRDGSDLHVAVGSGFLTVQKERTSALVRSAEHAEDIDAARAERAKGRAEQRLREYSTGIDIERARSALRRANARLKIIELERGLR